MPTINGINKRYKDLTDDDIVTLAEQKFNDLPSAERFSYKSILFHEDLILLRTMDIIQESASDN
jgi:hypothetical protein